MEERDGFAWPGAEQHHSLLTTMPLPTPDLQSGDFKLLKEDGDALLLEDGSFILV